MFCPKCGFQVRDRVLYCGQCGALRLRRNGIRVELGQTAAGERLQVVRAVLFDLDGTLADTRPQMIATIRELLHRDGRMAPAEDIARAATRGFPACLAVLQITHQRAIYWRTYTQHFQHSFLFPWVLPLLGWLRNRHVRVGVVTTLPTAIAQAMLVALGLEKHIETVVGAGDAPLKPDPAPLALTLNRLGTIAEQSIFIGDSPTDIQAAQAARCLAIGAGWGFHDTLTLAETAPELLFSSGPAFAAWLRALNEQFDASRCQPCPGYVYRDNAPPAQCEARCAVLANTIPVPPTKCHLCAAPLPSGHTCTTCAQRTGQHKQYVAASYCAWLYTDRDPLAVAIREMKGLSGMDARIELTLPLGRLFLPHSVALAQGTRSSTAPGPALPGPLVPVPTSLRSRSRRGFAPVEKMLTAFFAPLLVASILAMSQEQEDRFYRAGASAEGRALLQLPWDDVVQTVNSARTGWQILNLLEKLDGSEGKTLAASEREATAADVYRLLPEQKGAVAGRIVYLVDDVVTTGATINACARLLIEQAGAREVHVIALARNHRLQRFRTSYRCPACQQGVLVERRRRRDGKVFFSCSRWRFGVASSCQFTCEPAELGQWQRAADEPVRTQAVRNADEPARD